MSDSDIDETVASLPEETLKRIDEAFDRAISESQPEDHDRPRKRRRIAQDAEPELAGGFLLDGDGNNNNKGGNNEADTAGCFVVEDSINDEEQENVFSTSTQPTHIPLSLIPQALQLLDFDPSDEQVLSVFENAASSWSGDRRRRRPRMAPQLSDDEDEDAEPDQLVSRRDWRAVCAALMPVPNSMESPLTSVEESNASDAPPVLGEEPDSGSSAVQSADLDESEPSDSEDEYVPQGKGKGKGKAGALQRRGKISPSNSKTPSKKPRKGKTKESIPDQDISENATSLKSLTARQKQDTLAAFALFFPSKPKGTRSDLTEEELSRKKLTIRDVANAAASIKEKITAEEIIEMLSYFSSSASQGNPSMSFQEFQQMMIAAKLA